MDYGINERIKELREATGLTQEAFGAKIGMTRSEIKNIEYKKTLPKENKIPLIIEKFHVNETWLRSGIGDMLVERTRNEEIADFIADVISDPDESFRKRVITMLMKMTPAEWELFAMKAKETVGD